MPKSNKQEMLINTVHSVRSIVYGYNASSLAGWAMDALLNQSSPNEELGGTTPKLAEVDFSSN